MMTLSVTCHIPYVGQDSQARKRPPPSALPSGQKAPVPPLLAACVQFSMRFCVCLVKVSTKCRCEVSLALLSGSYRCIRELQVFRSIVD